MLRIKPCKPSSLPLKNLEWNKIAPYLGDAREAVARLDETADSRFLPILCWKEAIASARSQNIWVSLKETLLFAATGVASKKKELLLQKVLMIKQGMDRGISWRQRLGPTFFCAIHTFIKQDSAQLKDIGRIRTRQNWIGPPGCSIDKAYFLPPVASQVRPLFKNLSKYIEEKDVDFLVQTSVVFAQFLIIHPFMDGNGRVARAMIPIYAAQKKLTHFPILWMSAYFENNRREYFQRLYALRKEGSWEEWIVYFLKGVILQANLLREQIASLQNLFGKIVKLVGKRWAEKLFQKPILKKQNSRTFQLLVQKKILIAQGEEFYLFQPLIRTMRNKKSMQVLKKLR